MSKKNMFNKKFLIKSIAGLIAAVPLMAGFTATSSVIKPYSSSISTVSKDLKAFENTGELNGFTIDNSFASEGFTLLKLLNNPADGQVATDSGIGIKIPNFSDPTQEAQTKAQEILSAYSGIPSNIVTTGQNSNIEKIIRVDSGMWSTSGNGKYKIFNLGAMSTYSNNYQNATAPDSPRDFSSYNLTTESVLPAFNQRSYTDEEGVQKTENISESFFDKNGILALQVTVSKPVAAGTPTWESYYMLIPGFGGSLTSNASSNNPMLASNLYSSGVKAVSDNDLTSFLNSSWQFDGEKSRVPKISVVSRNNDAGSGILNFSSSFSFDLPQDIPFNGSFQGVTDGNVSNLNPIPGKKIGVDGSNNTYFSKISYDLNFKISGFQPSPAVSDTEVFIIVIVIIAAAVAISIAAFAVTLVTRKIRFKNKM